MRNELYLHFEINKTLQTMFKCQRTNCFISKYSDDDNFGYDISLCNYDVTLTFDRRKENVSKKFIIKTQLNRAYAAIT